MDSHQLCTADERINALQSLMKDRNIDAYRLWTSDFHRSEFTVDHFKEIKFLTGFLGTAGTVIVTRKEAVLWSDSRHYLQAEEEISGSHIRLYCLGKAGELTPDEYLLQNLPEGGTLGFDGRTIDCTTAARLMALLEDKKIKAACQENLVEYIWKDRPPQPSNPVWELSEAYTGQSAADKLVRVRAEMKKKKADIHLITTLDDVAWILNLRGNDIVHSPLFFSYLMLEENSASLYVRKNAVSAELAEKLKSIGVSLKDYDSFNADAAALRNRRILVEYGKANYALCMSLDRSNKIINAVNPSSGMKIVKNPVEIENMKKAHLKDGIASVKFAYWLKHTIGTRPLTEMDAAEKIEALRAEQGDYLEPSFTTIAAYRSNAAMVHYHPSKEKFSALAPEGLLLVDSGGHYLQGTTDFTRTHVLGPLTQDEKKCYTLVTISMLRSLTLKFLSGCTGGNLDFAIRENLWKNGLDCEHRTGHGVGFISVVHERLNDLYYKNNRADQNFVEFGPGMICSCEPGVYLKGRFGIRMENLILCVPGEKNEFGQFLQFEPLTVAPIDTGAIDTRYMNSEDLDRLNSYNRMVFEKVGPHLTDEEREWLREYTKPVQA